MFRFVCLLAAVAVCNAGIANYNGAAVIAPTVTSEQQNVIRSYGNLQQVSYNSKTIDTPYSSVSKSDVRVSNPGVQITHQPLAYAAPAYHQQAYIAQPKIAVAQPVAYASQAHYAPAAYHAAPAYHQQAYVAQPKVVAHQPLAYAAQPLAYSSPVVASAPAAKLLGVAYSPATSVSHMSYSAYGSNGSPLISYAW